MDLDQDKGWFELGNEIGLDIISDDESGAEEEEDREVERIYNESRNTQQKLLKGTNIDIICIHACMSIRSIQGV